MLRPDRTRVSPRLRLLESSSPTVVVGLVAIRLEALVGEVDGRTLRLFYSQRDFGLALSGTDFFMELDENAKYSHVELRRYRCYLDMAVISYCRPFTRARGLPLLTFQDIGIMPTALQLDLHERLMLYRHKVVAHSDIERMQIVVTTVILAPHADVVFPVQVTDEGLEFIEDRLEWIKWLHILRHALTIRLIAAVQAAGSRFRLHQDYLFLDERT